MVWPFVYRVGDRLSVAELTAARLDGDVAEVGDSFMPADAVETREMRAASLGDLPGPGLAVTHESAAWVHDGVGAVPMPHRVQRTSRGRLYRSVNPQVRYRDVLLVDGDTVCISGLLVTTLERTVADLVRESVGREQHGHDASHGWARARRLLDAHPGLADRTIAHLQAAKPLHHKRAAIDYLRRQRGAELMTT